MRHRKKLQKLGRKRDHRRGLVKNLVNDLFLHGKLTTTKTRAKVLRSEADRVVTVAKLGPGRETIRKLQKLGLRENVSRRLLTEYATRYKDRSSGFTTLSPVKLRKGDNALLVQVTLL